MTETNIQKAFKPCKDYLPAWMWNPLRSLFTPIGTPVRFSLRSGHFKSSFKKCAVSAKGEPIPWYTYPCMDFLRHRSYEGKTVLEFGGGQSTLWWASRAKNIVTFEGDQDWYDKIKRSMPQILISSWYQWIARTDVSRMSTKYWTPETMANSM
jgi:hypothetical protein